MEEKMKMEPRDIEKYDHPLESPSELGKIVTSIIFEFGVLLTTSDSL